MDKNNKYNKELFDILNSNSLNTNGGNREPEHYKLYKSNMKKRNLKINKKAAKGILSLSIGTVVILSGFLAINNKLNTDDNIEINYETTISENNLENIETIRIEDDNKETIAQQTETTFISSSKSNNTKLFSVGNSEGMYYVYDYIKTDEYEYFANSGYTYGIDPNIMVGIAMQESSLKHTECLPDGKYYNGCAIGILQLEQNCNNEVTAYNYAKGEDESISYSDSELCKIDNNIQVSFMRFQKEIEKYNGNIYMAIQAYNFGDYLVEKAAQLTSHDKNISYEEVLTNYSDLSWMEYIKDMHDNPQKYLSNWEYDTYGDDEYLSKVLSYCPNDQVTYKYNGENITFDLSYGTYSIENSKKL